MPQAVTHFLIPAILVALFRDFYLSRSKKRNFPLHYVLIAGLGGLLLDADYLLHFITASTDHRIFLHNIFIPAIFLIIGLIFLHTKINNPLFGKHKLKLSTIFFIISFATLTHLILDAIFEGTIFPIFPISNFAIGLNIIQYLPSKIQDSIIPIIDAVLLTCWMIYLELKHKISDFI